jgi:hypothetical protein
VGVELLNMTPINNLIQANESRQKLKDKGMYDFSEDDQILETKFTLHKSTSEETKTYNENDQCANKRVCFGEDPKHEGDFIE